METLDIVCGGAVKAQAGSSIISGLLIPFAHSEDLDHDGEYFDAKSDLGIRFPAEVKLFYNHGLNERVGRTPLAWAKLEAKADGIHFESDLAEDLDWLEGEREKAQKYQALTLKLAREGRLGASSGAAHHLVDRRPAGKAKWIARWPTAEASVTPHPSNPMTFGQVSVKALRELPGLEELEADLPPPGGAEKSSVAPTLAEHSIAVVSAVRGYVERVEDRAAFRLATEAKSGRMLSGANIAELEAVLGTRDTLTEMFGRIEALLEKARPKQDETADTPQTKPLSGLDTLRLQTRLLETQLGATV